jgi:hypothetical protein
VPAISYMGVGRMLMCGRQASEMVLHWSGLLAAILHTFGRLSAEHVCASIYGCYGGRDELYDLVVMESLFEENRTVRDERGDIYIMLESRLLVCNTHKTGETLGPY